MRHAMLAAIFLLQSATTWTPIASWSGEGTKETETFTITQREWRVTWTAKLSNPKMPVRVFSVAVYDAKTDVPVSQLMPGDKESAGESYVRGAGRYYLKIASGNAAWTVRVEEPAK
jgi:hypothetical protein